jgi:serine/threonine protein kinase
MHSLPRIPGYELLETLGGGPLTCVWSARDLDADQPCAVKTLRDNWPDHDTAVKLLQREARAGLTVRHRHLVRVIHTHVTRSPYFLVMDLLPGESLRQRLRREYRLDAATTIWIARQTAEALDALHRAGFVHGDVKPENVRLVGDGTAILIDLGFAHRPGENASLLRQGYVLGTANYVAPELCCFEDEAGPSSDLFSLGVTLFEMLSGHLPYPPGTVEQTFRRHRCDPPADIRTHLPSLPRVLVGVIEQLLARKPEDRPRAARVVQQLVALEIAALRWRRSA